MFNFGRVQIIYYKFPFERWTARHGLAITWTLTDSLGKLLLGMPKLQDLPILYSAGLVETLLKLPFSKSWQWL